MSAKSLVIIVGLVVAACGQGTEDSMPPQPTVYAQMSFGERAAFMTEVVLPRMTETFAAFDPKYANMSCTTCHGKGATDGTYAMPSPQIPPLPSSEEAFFEYMKDPEHARWSQFMIGEVWPKMASLLNLEKFDPTSHLDGFSCSNCHTLMGAPH